MRPRAGLRMAGPSSGHFFPRKPLRFNPHRSKSPAHHTRKRGEVPEWSNGAVSKTVEPARVPWVRIPPSPPLRNNGGHSARRRGYAVSGEHAQKVALRAHDADFPPIDLNPLRERTEMIAPVAAALQPDTLPRGGGELAKHRRRDRLLGRTYEQR